MNHLFTGLNMVSIATPFPESCKADHDFDFHVLHIPKYQLTRVHGSFLFLLGTNAGSGGVGAVATQLAAAQGAHITTTSSAPNQDLCRSLGAETCLDYWTQRCVFSL